MPGLFAGHDPTRGSGQEDLKMSRVGSGRVWRFSKCHGSSRVGSRGFQISRVGSGRGSDTRIWPVDPYFCTLAAACGRATLVTRGSCPRVRNDTILAASCLEASLGAIRRTPSAYQSVYSVDQTYQALATRHTSSGEPRVG